MKKSHSLILPVTLAVVFSAGFAGVSRAADLLSVYREAINYDAQFAAARSAVEAGREKLPQGRSGLLPTIGLGANTVWNDSEITTRTNPAQTAASKYNSHGWSVNLTQPLFRWQNWVTYTQSELAVEIAEAQFSLARQDLILRVSQAYFDVLLAEDTLVTAKAQLKAIAEQLESAKRNFEVGTATITESQEAQAAFDITTAQLLAAQSDLTIKRYALQVLVGKDVPVLKRLSSTVSLSSPEPNDMGKWVQMAETNSPGVRIATPGLEIADREIDKQRAGHYPSLDLVATRSSGGQGRNISAPAGIDSDSTTVGLQLSVPLFAGGAIASKDREAVALKDKASADLDNARRSAAQGARQAYLGVSTGLLLVKAYEAGVISTQSALDSTKLGYEVGVRINIDVLNAQSRFYDTRQKLAQARFNTLISSLKLKAAAGSLTEVDVQSVNSLLE